MAKVQQVILCPKCRMELKKEAATCAYCGFRWQAGNSTFLAPNYIHIQKESVKEDFVNWFKTCPHDMSIAAMMDALCTIRYLLYSNIPATDLKQITTIGKQIGELSQTIELYAQKGGYIEVAKPTTRLNSEEDTEETR